MDELRDFEAYLEPDFEPAHFANDLLLATNDEDTFELDLQTAVKRLKFDIDECDKRLKSISTNNYDVLILNFWKIQSVKKALTEDYGPLLERVNGSFDRIRSNVIEPYDGALKMNNAMKRIHTTLNLLRGSSYFLFMLQQLEESEKAYDTDENVEKEVVRLARLHAQLSQFYSNEKTSKTSQNLISIKLVRDYEPVLSSKRTSLILSLVSSIHQDFNHISSFSPENSSLQANLASLYILDPKEFCLCVERSSVSKQAQTLLNLLTRSLQSPRNFTSVLKDVHDKSFDYLETITKVLQHEVDSKTLLSVVETYFGNSIASAYWHELTHKFKKNIVATMARGGPIAKNLKVYKTGIASGIDELFEGQPKEQLTDALDMIK